MRSKRRATRSTLPPLPSLDPNRPPDVRLAARSGPSAIVRGEWRDPDDIRPNASRTARTIVGYRTYCPLRRCRDAKGDAAAYSLQHVLAADELRRLADAVLIGFGGRRDMIAIQAITYGPRTGPSTTAIRQARAWPAYRRAMAPFAAGQRELIAFVLLMNWSIQRWVARLKDRGDRGDPAQETGRLVAILDILAEHFSVEIERNRDAA
jgi:hypothetical protein